jgi:hypothetical protein
MPALDSMHEAKHVFVLRVDAQAEFLALGVEMAL